MAKEGTQLILLFHVNCVAAIVHSSEVKLGSEGVATVVLEQVPFFSGDVLFIRIFCCCPPEPEILIWYTCFLDTVYIMTSYTSLHIYGGEQYGRRDLPDWTCGTVSHRSSGYTHSHPRDGQILDDRPLSQSIEVSCNTGYQYSNCGDRTPHHTSGFLSGYLGYGCQTYIQLYLSRRVC